MLNGVFYTLIAKYGLYQWNIYVKDMYISKITYASYTVRKDKQHFWIILSNTLTQNRLWLELEAKTQLGNLDKAH